MRRAWVLIMAAVLPLTACEPETGTQRREGGGTKPPAKVDGIPTRAGTHRLKLDVGGPAPREYRLRVPPRLAEGRWRDGEPAKALPLVLAMHGGAANAAQMERLSGFDRVADREGLLVAYPEGFLLSWNAGFCCGPAKLADTDDVGFLTKLVRKLTRAGLADPDRVYATGFSNGAGMAYRLACEAPGTFAAVGAVSAAMAMRRCDPRPTSVLVMHGTADRNVPYDGGGRRDFNDARPFPPVSHAVDYWRKVNGLPPPRRTLTVGDGPDCRTTGRGGAGTEVALCRIEGGAHRWPDGAENTLWAFFAAHPRRG
ncbi:polyhydroxybutyrate depolymerase [Thermomonospora echinospora]|uniref:Polyhydroxybutyrate depolymerase n=1 Tax=Thermomonospora echinospora TaxID=1992 RepID=A0A1H5VR13_9ACTN|nr:PHB depolymerase family esterase [Thermomonospora echinospora]SEF89583.1 polyhydroxybutyrate depolymerase [Thermomonospora echinospora]